MFTKDEPTLMVTPTCRSKIKKYLQHQILAQIINARGKAKQAARAKKIAKRALQRTLAAQRQTLEAAVRS